MNKTILAFLLALGLTFSSSLVLATNNTPSDRFPSCPIGTGSFHSNEYGNHPVPGVGSITGYRNTDPVADNGINFIDCICDAESAEGYQIKWWDVTYVDQAVIDQYITQGWMFSSGSSAGLAPGKNYLGYVSNFNCDGGEVTPTPTPTSNPEVTPTPTTAVTITPTPTPTNSPSTDGGSSNGNGSPAGAPVCNNEVLPAPIILSVTRINPTTDLVRWTAIASAQHYVIAYGTQPGQYDYGVPNTGNVTEYEVSALDPNSTYYYQVTAQVGCMPGHPSAEYPYGHVLGLAATYGDQLIGSMAAVTGVASTLAAGYFTTKKFTN